MTTSSAQVEIADRYSYRVVYDPENEFFLATADEWPNVHAHGISLAEALNGIRTLVGICVNSMKTSGDPLPAVHSELRAAGKEVIGPEDALSDALTTILGYDGGVEYHLSRFRAGEMTVVAARTAGVSASLNAWYDNVGHDAAEAEENTEALAALEDPENDEDIQ